MQTRGFTGAGAEQRGANGGCVNDGAKELL